MEKRVKTFKCRDVGVDCDWITRAETEVDLVRLIREHAKNQHGIQNINQELERKIRNAIRDERIAA